jgi:amidase
VVLVFVLINYRIPSGFNGLFGLRPSHGRLPYAGAANSMDGQNTVRSVTGPISGSAGSLKLLTKSVLAQEPWLYDPLVVEMPWREQSKLECLTFGLLMTESGVSPQPPVRRALNTVVSLVKKLGHNLIEWNPPAHRRAIDIGVRFQINLATTFRLIFYR